MSELTPDVSEWIADHALPLESVQAGCGFEDLLPLREWIGAARVVGLGEATHGTRDFFQLKHRLLEFLVSDKGFTLFLIEAQFPQSLAVNRYVLTGEGDARHSLASLRYWDCEEVLDLIEWMRAWNAAHDRKIYFYGYDMQTNGSVIPLLDYLQRHAPESYHQYKDALLPLTVAANSYAMIEWASLSEAEITQARAAIIGVITALENLQPATAQERYELDIARLHAVVLDQHERFWRRPTGNEAGAVRDRAMAQNILALLKLHGPTSKAVVWAHNAHVELQPSGGYAIDHPSMGQHLRSLLGADYFVAGFAFDHGSFAARIYGGEKEMREWTVASTPGTMDAALAQAGPPIFALDLRTVPENVADWFAQARPSRSTGGVYHPKWGEGLTSEAWTRIDPRQHFHALLFVRKTAAARYNPTSYEFLDLSEEPRAAEALVNLDFGTGLKGWQIPIQPTVGAYQAKVVPGHGGSQLEVFRWQSMWPWDNYVISQTAKATPWRGKRIEIRCTVSMECSHFGSGAQLAARILQKRPADFDDYRNGSMWTRLAWQRVTTRQSAPQQLILRMLVADTADTILIALVMTGDGRASFGPVSVDPIP